MGNARATLALSLKGVAIAMAAAGIVLSAFQIIAVELYVIPLAAGLLALAIASIVEHGT